VAEKYTALDALASFLWSCRICWCVAEGCGSGDHRHPLGSCGLGTTSLFMFCVECMYRVLCTLCFRLCELRWVYLIKGVTEASPCKGLAPARFHTKARQRTEMRLEVLLSGCVGGPKQVMKCRPLAQVSGDMEPQQTIVGEG